MAASHHISNLCSTMAAHHALAASSTEYQANRRQIETETQAFTVHFEAEGLRTGVARIPIVVHVVHHTDKENVSDEQIQTQIDVLNADFRRTNADAGKVPAPFVRVAADARIEFALAVRDPSGAATNGITRTRTSQTGWTQANMEKIKSKRTGGADPWPSDKYLNLWVANFTDGLLGFAAFPGGPAKLDGVVIGTTCFGTIGTAKAPFNGGRTATHEIGHWLNLLHIWGDDAESLDDAEICRGTDQCADTPNQARDRHDKPKFPSISCNNGPNGDMFMNYMDYTDDDAMFMFTQGQVTRMNAALAGPRASILESDALVPVDTSRTSARALSARSLWMSSVVGDYGVDPLADSDPTWISEDIWVRNEPQQAGQLPNRCHQNPVAGRANQVHVRVHSLGSAVTTATASKSVDATLALYWAKASPSLAWPAPWDGSVTNPAVMGGPIGRKSIALGGGTGATSQVICFNWTPPDPVQYASFGAERVAFSLLARIETADNGMTAEEMEDLHANVQVNNKMIWKNVSIVDRDDDGSRFADVIVGQFGGAAGETSDGRIKLGFDTPEGEKPSLFNWGMVLVDLEGGLATKRNAGGITSSGFVSLGDGGLALTKSGATLEVPALGKGEFGTLHLRFVPMGKGPSASHVFGLDVTQFDSGNKRVGGQRVLLKTAAGRNGPKWDRQLGTFDGVYWTSKGKTDGGCGCGCK